MAAAGNRGIEEEPLFIKDAGFTPFIASGTADKTFAQKIFIARVIECILVGEACMPL